MVSRPEPVTATASINHALWLLGCAPLAPQLIGSAINIWYNLTHIEPLLTPLQHEVFIKSIGVYNVAVYPVAVTIWIRMVMSLAKPLRMAMNHHPATGERLISAQRRVINLPWWGTLLAAIGWLMCIPVFLIVLKIAPGEVNFKLFSHLPISIIISALIAITHGFFAIELVSQRLIYPVLFQQVQPINIPGTFPLSLWTRGLIWAVSAGICPICSLLLLNFAPQTEGTEMPWFSLAVGSIGIIFGLFTAWLTSQLVVEPVQQLQQAAQAVAGGNLNVRVDLLRPDELGFLIEDFNYMVAELREKQRLQETFGRHVGQKAAQQILRRDPGLGGVEQELTVMFADLRNFTARSSNSNAQQTVALLNLFLTEMVEVVERHGGMVNKFLGDGFMGLFGIEDTECNHAQKAVAAGRDMLVSLQKLNRYIETLEQPTLAMGIGIHTGTAVVGSIGSPTRLEYTAIGDTVNVASRIESLTKELGVPLLMSAKTRRELAGSFYTQEFPPQRVKGKVEALVVYGLGE